MSLLHAITLSLFATSAFASTIPSWLNRRATSDCVADTVSTSSGTYYISCNVDRPGGDFAAIQSPTQADCIQACTSDSRCVSATWVPDNQFCYLKDTITWESSSSTALQTITLGTGCENRDRTINGRQCTVQCGTDHQGYDYSSARLNSFEACTQACAADAQCATAQYVDSTGWCYLKSIVTTGNDIASNSNVDSIVCQQ